MQAPTAGVEVTPLTPLSVLSHGKHVQAWWLNAGSNWLPAPSCFRHQGQTVKASVKEPRKNHRLLTLGPGRLHGFPRP